MEDEVFQVVLLSDLAVEVISEIILSFVVDCLTIH